MRIIDRTKEAIGWDQPWQTRRIDQIKQIVIHHSATPLNQTSVHFERHWRGTKGWRNGGYAEVILPNGDVELNYPPTVVTNGAGVWNKTSYHICMVGNFLTNGAQPTAAQLATLLERVRVHRARFNVGVANVKGHKELMPTICPGMNMKQLRSQIGQSVGAAPPATENSVAANPGNETHSVARGDTFWSLARKWGVTVAEIQALNPQVDPNRLQVGARLNRPVGTVVPTGEIRVGSSVRVNQTAQSWATGQSLPAWVRGQTYTVKQIRNNHNELLLAGVMSWIRRGDVTLL